MDICYADALPTVKKITTLVDNNDANIKVSQLMMLKSKLAICVYHNSTRHNAWVYTVNKDGSGLKIAHTDNHKETIGMSYGPVQYNGKSVYFLPSEDPEKDKVLYIDSNSGIVEESSFNAPYQYSEVSLDGVAYFSKNGRSSGGFWNIVTGQRLNKNLSIIPGIVFGMVKDGDDYVCACDGDCEQNGIYYGLISSDGWKIQGKISDVNYANNNMIAFFRNGRVCSIDETHNIGRELVNTNAKARRSCQDVNKKVCYWTTHGPQQLWVTNGDECKFLADFGGDVVSNPEEEGSAFSSAVAMSQSDSNTVYVATTKENNNGWSLHKIDLLWCHHKKSSGGIKDRDFSKWIIYPYRSALWKEDCPVPISTSDPLYNELDFGLGGDIFPTAAKCYPNKNFAIKGQRRTWLMIHGSIEFNHEHDGNYWWSGAIPTVDNFLRYLNEYLTSEMLGIAVDTEGDLATNDANINGNIIHGWTNLKEAITEMERRVRRRLPIVMAPRPGWYEGNQIRKLNDFFDAALMWDYGFSPDEYISTINYWRANGFTKQVGIFQRINSGDESDPQHPYANEWRNFVIKAMNTTYQFDGLNGSIPVVFIPIALDGLSMPPPSTDWSWRNKILNGYDGKKGLKQLYQEKWPNPPSPYG